MIELFLLLKLILDFCYYLRPQAMIDKQSEQLSDVTREKERYKRDLEHVKVILTINMVVI